jgi:hypothetical protein
VTGYFTSTTTGMVYVPVTPCRIINTRSGLGGQGTVMQGPPQSGPLVATVARAWEIAYPVTVDDPVEDGNTCNLPSDVGGAYSVNVTVIPVNNQPIWFASTWGAASNITTGGDIEPPFSNVNATTGTVHVDDQICRGVRIGRKRAQAIDNGSVGGDRMVRARKSGTTGIAAL